MILDSFCVCYRPFMRPSKRPTNHFWISFGIKVFQWPLIEAKRGQRQKWPKMLILKSYCEYHIWGLQKAKNYSEIQIERSCNDFENSTFN